MEVKMNLIIKQKPDGDFHLEQINHISKLKDKELLSKFELLVKQEKEATAFVVAHLAEIDKRKLFAEAGYSSLFNYITQKYHYSQSAAYRRIQAARLSLRFPKIIEYLKDGRLNLITISLIEPYLKEENKEDILSRVFYKSTREVEIFISSISERQKEIRDRIRMLPQLIQTQETLIEDQRTNEKGKAFSEGTMIKTAQILTPSAGSKVSERRVKVEFCANETLTKKIERAKQILRHQYPQGRLEDIFNEALEHLLEKKDPERKMARVEKKQPEQKTDISRPKLASHSANQGSKEVHVKEKSFEPSVLRVNSRYIPEKLKLEIYKRDHGQCSYMSKDGKHCQEKNFLEMDHVEPFALGGKSTQDNLRLLCRLHNQYRSQKIFWNSN